MPLTTTQSSKTVLDWLVMQAEQITIAASHAAEAQAAGLAAWAAAYPIPESGFTEEIAERRREVARTMGLNDVCRAATDLEWARNAALVALANYKPADEHEVVRKHAALAGTPAILRHHVASIISRDLAQFSTPMGIFYA